MEKEKKCTEKNITRVCSRYGKNSRPCKNIIKSCSR